MDIKILRVLCKIQCDLLAQAEREDARQGEDDLEHGEISGRVAAYRDAIIRINDEIQEAL